MSGVKVCKFGGTSMANGRTMKLVKDIIENDTHRKYIVVSAPGKRNSKDTKVTDLLYQCYASMMDGVCVKDSFLPIRQRFEMIADELDLQIDIKFILDETEKRIEEEQNEEFTISRGEYLSARVFSEFIGADFIDAENVMFFNNDGTFDLSTSCKAISRALEGVERAVIPGFYGLSANGKIKTFSRGGSDITGAIVARAIDLCIYENWTDVTGFLACDPRIVQNPKQMKNVTYTELRELSIMGANVLHNETVVPVIEKNIPIIIKNTFCPEAEGTTISSKYVDSGYHITGISGKKNYTLIFIEKSEEEEESMFIEKVLNILAKEKVTAEHICMENNILSLSIKKDEMDSKAFNRIIAEIHEKVFINMIKYYENTSIIAVVGEGVTKDKSVFERIGKSLSKPKINFTFFDQSSMEFRILIGVNDEDYEKCINSLYCEFFC